MPDCNYPLMNKKRSYDNVLVKGRLKAHRLDVYFVEQLMTREELENCIDEYGTDIYSFCKYLTEGNLQEADDLFQDTFLRAVEQPGKIDMDGNPKSFLLSVALRLWRNKRRKFARRKRIADIRYLEEEPDPENRLAGKFTVEEDFLQKETDEAVRKAVNRLPEKLRIAVLLFYMEELSTTQIAEVLKIPAGTVLSRLHHARKLLRKELEDQFNG